MRSLVAGFLLLLHLAPSLAVGLCASGLPGGPDEVDCPMSHPGSASPMQPPASGLMAMGAESRAHCCGAADLCMFSAPAILSGRSTLVVLPAAYQPPFACSTTSLARERAAPPSPPPNA
jgi:hypothetical protein